MTSRIPDHWQQMVHYYGYYSNLSKGFRQKVNQKALIPLTYLELLLEPSHLTVGRVVQVTQYSSLFIAADCRKLLVDRRIFAVQSNLSKDIKEFFLCCFF